MNLDEHKLAVDVTSELIKSTIGVSIRGAKSVLKNQWAKVFEDFGPYMQKMQKKNTSIRTIINKNGDINLYDIYVPLLFNGGGGNIVDQDIFEQIISKNRVIISGNGGSGKTIFLKHLWNLVSHSEGNFIPLFVELRGINNFKDPIIEVFIRNSISGGGDFGADLFEWFCSKGQFIFIFDGFDEVSEDKKSEVEKEILRLSEEYPDCGFVLSSRPHQRFIGWSGFQVYETCKLNKEQVENIVDKVEFPKDIKKDFLNKFRMREFQKNNDVMTTPLLVMMMLITFSENSDILSNQKMFFDNAVHALYIWHNSTKQNWNKSQDMGFVEFKESFGVFCLLSYMEDEVEFDRDQVERYINKSSQFTGCKMDSSEILRHYAESVNLLQRDGAKYVFVHRSFQEYFSAYAIVHIFTKKYLDFMDAILNKYSDDVFSYAYYMNKNLFVKDFVREKYNELIKPINNKKVDEGRFYSLNILNVSFLFVFDARDRRYRVLMGSGSNANKFIDIIKKIAWSQKKKDEEEGKLKNIVSIVGRIIGKSIDTKVFKDNIVGEISFAEDDIRVNVFETDGIKPYSIEKSRRITDDTDIMKNIDSSLSVFSDLANYKHKEINSIRSWCQREIGGARDADNKVDDLLRDFEVS
jgi:energy-coupling factor transporter ATP-binding protein EcfA2